MQVYFHFIQILSQIAVLPASLHHRRASIFGVRPSAAFARRFHPTRETRRRSPQRDADSVLVAAFGKSRWKRGFVTIFSLDKSRNSTE
jgi:hypothetical protein